MREDDRRTQTFYIPTRVFFGHGVLKEKGIEMAQFGERALLVTGRHSADTSGVMAELIPVLTQAGISTRRFNEVTENPDWDTVRRACAEYVDFRADFVIGIGGGSPLDAAKAVAIMVHNGSWKEASFDLKTVQSGKPIVAIPTTSGTGSEATPHSVISDAAANRKAGFSSEAAFPRMSFVDPRYTHSLPPNITRDTAVDALSHLLEGLYSNKRNPLLFPMIYEGISLIYKHLPLCLDCPTSEESRFMLSRAALLGGMVIAHTGTTLQHSIGYPLTMEYGLSHGLANGVVMRQIMELYYPVMETELNLLFRQLGIGYADFFRWLERLDMRVGKPVSGDFMENRVSEVINSRNTANTPVAVTEAQIRRIYAQLK
jgi:alcohol dehydrogenase class IV